MKKNIGTTDKVIRISIATILVLLVATHTVAGLLSTVFLALAAVLVLTSLISFCPLYLPFGIKTCKSKRR